ncbi:hypothetical protein PAJ34TS1_28950 [Paenibacillus azoreducens]
MSRSHTDALGSHERTAHSRSYTYALGSHERTAHKTLTDIAAAKEGIYDHFDF